MPKLDATKFIVPAAVAGCLVVAGLAWRVLGSEPTLATIEPITPDVASVERSSRLTRTESIELVSVVSRDVLEAEFAAEAARRAAESAPEGEPDAQEQGAADARSMELEILLPADDRVLGEALSVVLDQPEGGAAPRSWTAKVELADGEETVEFNDLPAAKSFRVGIFQGETLYARTVVQVGGPSQASVKLDFASKFEQEQAAIATLRSIAAAQQQLQASAAIDTDADGGGEHGYFAELAGTLPIRNYAPGGATVDPNGSKLDPTYLPSSMGEIVSTPRGGAMVREGYAFMIYLPDDSVDGPIGGIAESQTGGSASLLPGSANAEVLWCCYAWPVEPSTPTRRAFMINHAGDVVATQNDAPGPYVGVGSAPHFDAAYSVPGDMGSALGLTTDGLVSTDQLVWTPIP